jgi:hypothetical protein
LSFGPSLPYHYLHIQQSDTRLLRLTSSPEFLS